MVESNKNILKKVLAAGPKQDDEGMYRVPVFAYAGTMPSKGDEYAACRKQGYHMPPPMYCSRAYCRSVLLKEQPCPKDEEIPPVYMKKYEDASIANFFTLLQDKPTEMDAVSRYLPRKRNERAKPVKLNREWIFNIGAAKAPETWEAFKKHVAAQQEKKKKEQARFIMVSQAGLNALIHDNNP